MLPSAPTTAAALWPLNDGVWNVVAPSAEMPETMVVPEPPKFGCTAFLGALMRAFFAELRRSADGAPGRTIPISAFSTTVKYTASLAGLADGGSRNELLSLGFKPG